MQVVRQYIIIQEKLQDQKQVVKKYRSKEPD
jgi:hypothetical protein